MTYVMSDIHGCYRQYADILKKIDLREADSLYILGDVVDRGAEPIAVLRDMRRRTNVYPLMGNHDYIARVLLRKALGVIESGGDIDEALAEDLRLWFSDGGEPTFEAFVKVPEKERGEILKYMAGFIPYKELAVNGRKYMLTHAGLPEGWESCELDEFRTSDYVQAKTDYGRIYFEDTFLVTGHTPTMLIDTSCEGKIYRANNHIAIDAGAVFGGLLACLCLDNDEEYYV